MRKLKRHSLWERDLFVLSWLEIKKTNNNNSNNKKPSGHCEIFMFGVPNQRTYYSPSFPGFIQFSARASVETEELGSGACAPVTFMGNMVELCSTHSYCRHSGCEPAMWISLLFSPSLPFSLHVTLPFKQMKINFKNSFLLTPCTWKSCFMQHLIHTSYTK